MANNEKEMVGKSKTPTENGKENGIEEFNDAEEINEEGNYYLKSIFYTNIYLFLNYLVMYLHEFSFTKN